MQEQLGFGHVWKAHTHVRLRSRNQEIKKPTSATVSLTPDGGFKAVFPLCTKQSQSLTKHQPQRPDFWGSSQSSRTASDVLLHPLPQGPQLSRIFLNTASARLPINAVGTAWKHQEVDFRHPSYSFDTTAPWRERSHNPTPPTPSRPCCDSNKGKRSALILPGQGNIPKRELCFTYLIYNKGQNNSRAAPASGSKLIPFLSPWLRSPELSCTWGSSSQSIFCIIKDTREKSKLEK